MVSGVGISSLVFSSYIALFLGMGSYIIFSLTQNGAVISCVIGAIFSFIIFKINKYILENNNKDNISELIDNIFKSKLIRFGIKLILTLSLFIIFCFVLSNISEFLNVEYLPESNINYLKVLVLIPLVYLSSKKLINVVRVNQIFSIISFVILLIDIIGTSASWDYTSIKPLWDIDIKKYTLGVIAYVSISAVPFFLLGLFGNSVKKENKMMCNEDKEANIKNKIDRSKVLNITFIVINIIQVALFLVSTLILGREYLNIFKFPEYVALKQFSLFNILERIENILAIQFFFCSFSFLSILIHYIVILNPKCIKREIYPVFVSIMGYIVTSIIVKNTVVFNMLVREFLVAICMVGIILPTICVYIKLKMLEKVNKSLLKG